MQDTKNTSFETHYTILDPVLARELAAGLLKINAVILRPDQPMTWASGWNSPIYCDNRLTLRYPELRNRIKDGFIRIVSERYPSVDVITGTATAGIPHAAWVAQDLDKPMAYVRAKAKSHGLGNQIEGRIEKGESTLIIEDLISTGGSVLSVMDAVEFIGASVNAVLSIFTYGFRQAGEKFAARGVQVYSLTDYATLIEVAQEMGYVKSSDLETLNDWRTHPETWPA